MISWKAEEIESSVIGSLRHAGLSVNACNYLRVNSQEHLVN